MSFIYGELENLKDKTYGLYTYEEFFRKKRVLREKAELWDYLDQCGVQFRTPKSELIKLHGSRNCGWTDSLDFCELGNGGPVFRKLAHPFIFQFNPSRAQGFPPSSIHSYIRKSDNAYVNYDYAKEQICALFGDGSDHSTSNAKQMKWIFGNAEISAIIFPPSLNPQRNGRHEKIPGSATECKIAIHTAYCPPLSELEKEAVKHYRPLSNLTYPHALHRPLHITDTIRKYSAALLKSSAGFGFDKNMTYFIRIDDSEQLHILPMKWITSVQYFQLKPAKGSGNISISIKYMVQGRSDFSQSNINLIREPYVEGKHRDLAKTISLRLKIPLEQFEQYDC